MEIDQIKRDIEAFEAVLNRRALQYDRMLGKDVFAMGQDEQDKHAALCRKLGEEILVMARMIEIVGELAAAVQGPTVKELMGAERQYVNLQKNYIALLQSHDALTKESSLLIDLHVNFRHNPR